MYFLCGSFLIFVFLCFIFAKNLVVYSGQQSVREELGFIDCESEIMSCPAQFQEIFLKSDEVVA